MHKAVIAIPLLLLTSCYSVDSPWVGLDYSKAECGKEAILTTTGCITSPPVPTAPANSNSAVAADRPADVNDVSQTANHSGHGK